MPLRNHKIIKPQSKIICQTESLRNQKINGQQIFSEKKFYPLVNWSAALYRRERSPIPSIYQTNNSLWQWHALTGSGSIDKTGRREYYLSFN